MKNVLKSIFKLDLILQCFIWAIGYGTGYNIPSYYGCNLFVCLISCFALGFLFDLIGNKIISLDFYKKNTKNKIIVAVCVYISYVVSWFIVNRISGYDLDYDFLFNLAITIIIQIVLLFITPIKNKIINKIKHKELDDDYLEKISGGDEPEEFDWRSKGYTTPIKDDSDKPGWKFEAIGNVEGQYFKKRSTFFHKDENNKQ